MGTFVVAATILVSAASSLTDVLADLARRFEAATGHRVRVNAAASNTLARQIVEGAPVDLFISADDAQMDIVERAGRLVAGTRAPLVGNRLVVIVPAASALTIADARDLAAPHIARVAMGNPAAVPAGVYGRRWLEQLGLWSGVERKLIQLPTVRAALAAVREGRADAGIVYATDARGDFGVRIAYAPPPKEVGIIVYPAALVVGPERAVAAQFLEYLRSPEAASVFQSAGFPMVVRQ